MGNDAKNIIRFIIGSLDVGGAEIHLSRVLPRLKTDAFSPIVITLTHKGKLSKTLEESGVPVYEPSKFVRFMQQVPIFSRLAGPLLTIIYLLVMFIRIPAKITCFYLPSSYYLGMIASIIFGDVSNTIMFRRSLNDYQKNISYIRYFERLLHKRTNLIVGNCQAIIHQLMNDEGVSEKKLLRIYNGISIKKSPLSNNKHMARTRLNIDDETIVLSIIANLLPYKGHHNLVEALGMISNEINQPWLLISAGAGIQKRQDLKDIVKEYNLTRNIRWLGQRDDVSDILLASDIGLLVSHQEGFSNAILENMAASIPMIVTNVGGNSEAVVHGETGLIISPNRPRELSEAIMVLINDSELRKSYGENARTRVEEHFSMKSCVDNYKKLFTELIDKR